MDYRFVIQFHRASKDHWDLRLEMDGVLKSWAVPKEPPSATGIRRLAVQVEDHDIEYLDFEGVIPEGEYGAGTVEIWDRGTYTLESRSENEIKFTLNGSRLKGGYVLLRLQGRNWLLFKRKSS